MEPIVRKVIPDTLFSRDLQGLVPNSCELDPHPGIAMVKKNISDDEEEPRAVILSAA